MTLICFHSQNHRERIKKGTDQLRNRFGKEVVVTIEGGGLISGGERRRIALEVEMRENLAIGQGLQQQLLRELFFLLC